MDPIFPLLRHIDPFLIAPYRWLANPMAAFWVGTAFLSLWATIFSELTYALGLVINRKFIKERSEEMVRRHNQSMQALKAGKKEIYTGANKLANEAFGKGFFLQLAMGAASLWPAFFSAAWLDTRFKGIDLTLPFVETTFTSVAGFILLHIVMRVGLAKLKPKIPFLRGLSRLGKSVMPTEAMEGLPSPPPRGGKKEPRGADR